MKNGKIISRLIGDAKYIGYSEDGMIEDAWGGAIETIRFHSISIMNLLDILESIPEMVAKYGKTHEMSTNF